MKYKVGDEVLVKAVYVKNSGNDAIFEFLGANGDAYKICPHTSSVYKPDMTAKEAWEIAKKILLYPSQGGYNSGELEEIFGRTEHLWELTPQEAKAKIEAWEAEKEIKVGDVVIETSVLGSKYIGVVTQITGNQNSVCMAYSDGSVGVTIAKRLKKTGRHVDIEGLLKQIGGDE